MCDWFYGMNEWLKSIEPTIEILTLIALAGTLIAAWRTMNASLSQTEYLTRPVIQVKALKHFPSNELSTLLAGHLSFEIENLSKTDAIGLIYVRFKCENQFDYFPPNEGSRRFFPAQSSIDHTINLGEVGNKIGKVRPDNFTIYVSIFYKKWTENVSDRKKSKRYAIPTREFQYRNRDVFVEVSPELAFVDDLQPNWKKLEENEA